MKKSTILTAVAVLAAALISACSGEAEYITKQTRINLYVKDGELRAGVVKIDITPENDKIYYFCDILTPDKYTPGTGDERFMQLTLDSLYRDYIDWRYDLLKENSPYVATFSSHCLCYGCDERMFADLKPDTDYIVYAYCVNPETNQPMGDLYWRAIHTATIQSSDLTFEWKFQNNQLVVIPSNDTDYYLLYVIEKDVVDDYYEGDCEAFLQMLIEAYCEYGLMEKQLRNSISKYDFSDELEDDRTYYIILAGYDGELTTDIFVDTFTPCPAPAE